MSRQYARRLPVVHRHRGPTVEAGATASRSRPSAMKSRPLRVAHQPPGDPHRSDEDLMGRTRCRRSSARSGMADAVDTRRQRREHLGAGGTAAHAVRRRITGTTGSCANTCRMSVDGSFLVLLLMLGADFQDAQRRRELELRNGCEQPLDRSVDVCAIGGDLCAIGPRSPFRAADARRCRGPAATSSE